MDIHVNKEVPDYDEDKLLKTIDISKREFRRGMAAETMSSREFLLQQLLSLSKKYWLLQITVFLVAAVALGFMNLHSEIGRNKISYCAIFAPMLIISSIPELWRNISSEAYEVENTTFFDLKKLYFSRLVLVGMFDLVLATALTAITVRENAFSAYEAAVYFFVPFNLNCCICFTLLCSKRRIISQYMAGISCIAGASIWYMLVRNYHIYEKVQLEIWYALLIATFAYLIFAGKRIIEAGRGYLEVCKWN